MPKKNKILVIGAGALGVRHIESILSKFTDILVDVYDISDNSVSRAKKYLNKYINYSNLKFVTFENIEQDYYLVIDSTTANSRFNNLLAIRKKVRSKYWLIEKVLEQDHASLIGIKDLFNDNSCVWVNLPRRLMPSYLQLKNMLKPHQSINVNISGFNIGIGSNLIHFVDLVRFLTNSDVVEINASDTEWVPSKRNNCFELNGKVCVTFTNNSTLTITDKYTDGVDKNYLIEFRQCEDEFVVNELSQTISHDGIVNIFKIPYQSELTAIFLNDLIEGNKILLTPLSTSINDHLSTIAFFMKHSNFEDKVLIS